MNPNRTENATAPAADAWLTPQRFALILAALVAVTFPNVLTGTETFFFRDYANFSYPVAFYTREAFWRGQVPLWNPLNYCGVPFLAQWNLLTLYPPSLFYLLLPMPWALGVFCLLHLFFGGMGMYYLARNLTGSQLGAAVAGLVFAFNGLTWQSLMWPNNSTTFDWMPWVVLAAQLAWRRGGRWIFIAAFAGAMQMLSGAPEIILLTWGFAGAWWLMEFCGKPGERTVPRNRMLSRFICVAVLVTALAAAQLLPFLDFLAHSQRDKSFGDSQWSMPATGAANYLVPLFHYRPGTSGVPQQTDQYWTSSYFLGVGTIALVFLAAWRIRRREVWLLLTLAAASVVLAMGDNGLLYAWLRRMVPQLGFMRYPVKFVVLTTFVVPLLAAYALAWLQALPAGQWPRERRRLFMLGFALLALLALISWFAWRDPKPLDLVSITLQNAALRAVFLVAILGCLWALCGSIQPRPQLLLQTALLLLFWFDVYTHAPNLSPTVDPSVYQADRIRSYRHWDAQQLAFGQSRAMATPEATLKIMFGAVPSAADNVTGQRLTLFADQNLLDHVAKVDGFFSVNLREADDVNVYLYTLTNGLAPLKDFLGVSLISNPTNVMDWVPRDSFMPLITVGQEPRFADGPAAFRAIVDDHFEPRKIVYLPMEAQSAVTAARRPEAKVISQKCSAQEFDADVEAAAPAMLVVAQSYYHDWRAYVDAQPVRLWKANYAFQALEFPAGRHQIKLVYQDHAFWCGGVISLAAFAVCAFGCLPRGTRASLKS